MRYLVRTNIYIDANSPESAERMVSQFIPRKVGGIFPRIYVACKSRCEHMTSGYNYSHPGVTINYCLDCGKVLGALDAFIGDPVDVPEKFGANERKKENGR